MISDQINSIKGYCQSVLQYNRRQTREVNIGSVPLGGNNPIRLQSMTTTDTLDTLATVEQSIRMIEAGSEYIRITAPSLKEAQNLAEIKKELKARGYDTPLIADIHFTPNAAELAARIVEKVRINPGNYADKKKFEVFEYSDDAYEQEIERIRAKFTPLVKICKEYGTAMRIGTNHGSLSDRIMNRYGDSPEGMVESALEFLRIAEAESYHNIVLSMKSSNPIVMIQAYRLLVARMEEENMHYPLHLGVTEAGEDEEGRIKSSLGIGTLLEDGLGDTIRVSLTEAPEFEIPVASKIVSFYSPKYQGKEYGYVNPVSLPYNPYLYQRRISKELMQFGGLQVPRVLADVSNLSAIGIENLSSIGYHYKPTEDKWHSDDQAADWIYFGNQSPTFMLPNGAKALLDYKTWIKEFNTSFHLFPLLTTEQYLTKDIRESIAVVKFIIVDVDKPIPAHLWDLLVQDNSVIVILNTSVEVSIYPLRKFFIDALQYKFLQPILIWAKGTKLTNEEQFIIDTSKTIGALLADGFGDGIMLSNPKLPNKGIALCNRTAFNILQASRTRISKTEYISCPSCGRTLFDLQETTAMIRKETDHLKGVKIAIMGCIVNGPGEMADADFGYVGTGVNKITLYRGKEVVRKNLDSQFALQELINLIKEEGYWIDKQSVI